MRGGAQGGGAQGGGAQGGGAQGGGAQGGGARPAAPPPSSGLPKCPAYRNCHEYFFKQNAAHMASCKHLCRKGTQCPDVLKPEHQVQFDHAMLPPCKDGARCALLRDTAHREAFSHPGFYDILIPCRSGPTCPEAGDQAHYSKYKH